MIRIGRTDMLNPVIVAAEFCRDWTLPPLAYTLLVRVATAEHGTVRMVGDVAPDAPATEVAEAVELLIERGHLVRSPDGSVALRWVGSDDHGSAEAAQVEAKPNLKVCALYRWFDASRRLLYVGITEHLTQRCKAHAKSSRWYTLAVGEPTVEWFPNRPDAARAEIKAINSERPLFNGNPDDRDRVERRLRKYLDEIGRPDLMPTEYVNAAAHRSRTPRPGTPAWAKRYGRHAKGRLAGETATPRTGGEE